MRCQNNTEETLFRTFLVAQSLVIEQQFSLPWSGWGEHSSFSTRDKHEGKKNKIIIKKDG